MKNAFKKMLSLVLVAMLLVTAVPFQAHAEGTEDSVEYAVTLQLCINGAQQGGKTYTMYFREEGATVDSAMVKAQAERKWPNAEINGKWVGLTYGYATTDTGFLRDAVTVTSDMTINVYMTAEVGEETTETTTEATEATTEATEATQPEITDPLKVYIYEKQSDGNYKSVGLGVTIENGKLNEATAKEALTKAGYTVANWNWKWQQYVDGEANLLIDPIYTPGNKVIYTLRIQHNDGTSGRDVIEVLEGDSILNAIKKANLNLSRDGYTQDPIYYFDMNCTDAIGKNDKIEGDTTVYASWIKNTKEENEADHDVILRIYTNGNKKNVAKKVTLGSTYTSDGKVTQAEVKAIVNKYFEAEDGKEMEFKGLFTQTTWNGGDFFTSDAVSSITVNKNSDTVIYVLVNNVYKSDNPSTGDEIFMAVTVMALSATALFVLVLNNKKRFVK